MLGPRRAAAKQPWHSTLGRQRRGGWNTCGCMRCLFCCCMLPMACSAAPHPQNPWPLPNPDSTPAATPPLPPPPVLAPTEPSALHPAFTPHTHAYILTARRYAAPALHLPPSPRPSSPPPPHTHFPTPRYAPLDFRAYPFDHQHMVRAAGWHGCCTKPSTCAVPVAARVAAPPLTHALLLPPHHHHYCCCGVRAAPSPPVCLPGCTERLPVGSTCLA